MQVQSTAEKEIDIVEDGSQEKGGKTAEKEEEKRVVDLVVVLLLWFLPVITVECNV
jgi:hypothetical protein